MRELGPLGDGVIRLPATDGLSRRTALRRAGRLVVDTNPLNFIDRAANRWDPAHLEISA